MLRLLKVAWLLISGEELPKLRLIALGGIVCNKSIRIAGDGFTADIQAYMRHQHNIKIGERTAEDIKIGVGAALPDIDNPPPDFVVRGPEHHDCVADRNPDFLPGNSLLP